MALKVVDIRTSTSLHWQHLTKMSLLVSIKFVGTQGHPAQPSSNDCPQGARKRAPVSMQRPFFVLSAILLAGILAACSPELPDAEPEASAEDLALALKEAGEMAVANQPQEAADRLQPLFPSHPESRELNLAYGRALMASDRISIATWHLQRAAEAPDAPRDVIASYVYTLTMGGAEVDAVEVANRVLERDPDADSIRFQRITALASVMKKEEALEDLDYLLDKKPDAINLLQAQFNILLELERWDDARSALDEIGDVLESTEAPQDRKRQFCAARGKFETDRGEFAVAHDIFERCLAMKADDVDVIFLVEELLDAEQKNEEATEYLEAAAQRLPRHLRIQLRLASRYFRLGEEEQGAETLTRTANRIGSTTAWLSLADRRVLIGDLPGAVEAIDKAIAAETGMAPNDPEFDWGKLPIEGAFAFGDVFIRAEEFGRAEEIIAFVDQEEKAYALLLRARLELVRGDPAAALATYDEAFKYNPSNPGARYLAGRAAMEVGDFERGASLYQDALRSDASANDAGLVLARMQMAQSLPGACIDTLGYYMRLNQDQPHGLRLFAKAATALGVPPPAEGARSRLAENPAWTGIALADHAQELALSEGTEAAASYLEENGDLENPGHFDALIGWIETQRVLEKLPAAAARVERLAAATPDAAGFQLALGHVRQRQGRLDDAVAAYTRGTELAPALLAAHRKLGNALAELDRTDEALEAYERAKRLDLLDAEPAYLAAQHALDAGRTETAEKLLTDVLIQHPWHGGAALNLAQLRADAGTWDEKTRILARQAVRFIAVSGPQSLVFLAQSLVQEGKPEEAVPALRRAMALGLGDGQTRFLLARTLAEAGLAGEAKAELEVLLAPDLDPETPGDQRAEFEERAEAEKLLAQLTAREAA